ncbi:unnamed protein product [Haemonchus placei]|uniref:Uncharacterized protein n=1 Tax=Haemonchus placei TaxID=6290 RepID=A0A0N4W3Y9_HAEPC|nr:unnamed protein product [Haemonchus placei]
MERRRRGRTRHPRWCRWCGPRRNHKWRRRRSRDVIRSAVAGRVGGAEGHTAGRPQKKLQPIFKKRSKKPQPPVKKTFEEPQSITKKTSKKPQSVSAATIAKRGSGP